MIKRFSKMVLFLVLVNSAAAQTQESHGYLTILTQVRFDQITIDDSIYLQSDKIMLPAGTHELLIRNPDRASFQSLDFAKTITIRPGETETVEVHFDKLAEMNSMPGGVSVFDNSELLGITPFYIRLQDCKGHTLQWKKPGYEDGFTTVADSTIENNYLFISLNPKIKNQSNNQNQFVNLEWQERGPHKYKSAIWLSNGLGIVFGAGAAYYKKKADDAFEKAKIARRLGDVQARERQLTKTRKYDRYAAIGFVGMQVNVAALVYFLFRSR